MSNSQAAPAPAKYHVYLLRLWRETANSPWRLSLQESASSECQGFPDLETLVEYLLWVMEKPPSKS